MAGASRRSKASKSPHRETLNVKMSQDDIEAWVSAAAEATMPDLDEVPPDWHPMRELVAVMQKSHSVVNRYVQTMVNSGMAEMKQFRIMVNGRLKNVPHYRLKKKA